MADNTSCNIVDKKRVRIVYRVRHETVEMFIIAIGKRDDTEHEDFFRKST